MSYFISFEPLIVPVYARCFCLYAVLLSTRHSNHDPLLTLTRSRMTTLQEEKEEGEEEEDKCLVSSQVSHLICMMQQFSGSRHDRRVNRLPRISFFLETALAACLLALLPIGF